MSEITVSKESTQGLLFAPAKDGAGFILTGLGKCKDEEIVIEGHEGKPVVGIAKGALKGGKFTAITLAPSVKTIGKGAFAKCSELDRVYISDLAAWCSIRFEDGDANPLYYAQRLFLNGEEVTEITIPEGIETVENYAFYRFSALTSLSFAGYMERIGECAFSGCTGLTKVFFPEHITYFEKEAFSGCTSLEELQIPTGTFYLNIGDFAFEGCKKLHTLVVKGRAQSCGWGKGAFHRCDSLTRAHFCTSDDFFQFVEDAKKKIFPGYTVVSHDERGVDLIINAWGYVEGVTDFAKVQEEFTVPAGVRGIASDAFAGCFPLKTLHLPDGFECIEKDAFPDCTALSDLTLGKGAIEIEEDALRGTLLYDDPTRWDGDVFYLGEHLIQANKSLTGSYTIRPGTKYIASGAFSGCKDLTEITVPESLVESGENAFYDCSQLTHVRTPSLAAWCQMEFGLYGSPLDNAEEFFVNGARFEGDVVLPQGITHVGSYAFENCTRITSVTLPEGVTRIGNSAFLGCAALTAISLPGSVSSIGEWAFSNCGSLAAIQLPQGLKTLESRVLCSCDGLTHVTVPEGVVRIKESAFQDCRNLSQITLPQSLIHIGASAFADCPKLTQVTLPQGLLRLEKEAFANCVGLSAITLPEDLVEIGENAFLHTAYEEDAGNWEDGVLYLGSHLISAKNLTLGAYTVKDGTRCIADNAFEGCRSIYTITLPEGVTSIGALAFAQSTCASINLPDSIQRIGCEALVGTRLYENAAWWNGEFLRIGNHLVAVKEFHGSCTLPDGIRCIADYAFSQSRISNVYLPEGLTVLGERTFCNCWNLKDAFLPSTLERIGEDAFWGCEMLCEITLPKSVTHIASGAFEECDILIGVHFEEPEGWRAEGDPIPSTLLADPTKAAIALRGELSDSVLQRN